MVRELRIDVPSVVRELGAAMGVLTEAKIVSRYRKIFKGRGLEFEDFRDYISTDDAKNIDWKASKRANKLIIRRFKEERDMNVYFMVDVSNSMLFGSTNKLKYEYAAELAAALMHFVLESGDKVGLILFNEKVVKFVKPKKGEKHFYIMLNHLITPDYYGGSYNITSLMEFMEGVVKERSLGFLISDFIGLERDWQKSIQLISGKLDGIAVMVRDPRDLALPTDTGQIVISDPYSTRKLLIDCNDSARYEYELYVKSEIDKIKMGLKLGLWDMLMINTAEPFILPVIRFLKRREILFR